MASKVINELTLKLNADAAELKKDLIKAKAELSSFNKGVTSIGASIKGAFSVVAIAAAGKALIDFGQDVVKMGASLTGVQKSFNQLSQPGLLKELQDATGGTVNNIELMRLALDASDMKVPFEKISGYLKYIRQDTQESGKSMMELADTLITGLGKNSPKALAQLGISTKEYKEELAKVGNMADAVSNIMDRRLKETGNYVETAADVTKRWGATWDNIKANIGQLISNALVKIAPILDSIGAWFVKVWQVSSKWIIDTYNGFVDLYNNSMIFRIIVEGIGIAFKNAWNIIKLVFNMIVDTLKGVGGQLAYVFNPKNWGAGFGKGLQDMQKENANEFLADIKNFGKETAETYTDAFANIAGGKMKKISSLIPEWLSGGNVATNTGGGGGGEDPAKGKGVAKGAGEVFKLMKTYEAIPTIDLGKKINIQGIQDKTVNLKEIIKGNYNSVILETELLAGSLNSTFEMIGQGLAEALTGGGLKSVLDGFINIISDFAGNLGKQMIAIGTAGIALKLAFKNPYTAIAAGIGLVALNALIKKTASKPPKFANGGIVGGYSFSGDRVPILANSGEMVLNSGQQSSLFNQLNGGGGSGGGTLTARVSGNDLLFVLTQAQKKQNYSY